jgi:hypothetical protein
MDTVSSSSQGNVKWTARMIRRSRGAVRGVLAEMLGAWCNEHRQADFIAQREIFPVAGRKESVRWVATWAFFGHGPSWGCWPGDAEYAALRERLGGPPLSRAASMVDEAAREEGLRKRRLARTKRRTVAAPITVGC